MERCPDPRATGRPGGTPNLSHQGSELQWEPLALLYPFPSRPQASEGSPHLQAEFGLRGGSGQLWGHDGSRAGGCAGEVTPRAGQGAGRSRQTVWERLRGHATAQGWQGKSLLILLTQHSLCVPACGRSDAMAEMGRGQRSQPGWSPPPPPAAL